MYLSDLSAASFDAIKNNYLLIIPFGSVESHSSHLPIGTDKIILKEVIRKLIEKSEIKIIVAPFINYSPVNYLRTLSEKDSNIRLDSVAWSGYIENVIIEMKRVYKPKKIMLLTWHDTYDFVAAIRNVCFSIHEKNFDRIDLLRVWCVAYDYANKNKMIGREERHAAFIETSLIKYIRPQSFFDNGVVKGSCKMDKYYAIDWNSQNCSGVCGDFSKSNALDGEKLLINIVDIVNCSIVKYFCDI